MGAEDLLLRPWGRKVGEQIPEASCPGGWAPILGAPQRRALPDSCESPHDAQPSLARRGFSIAFIVGGGKAGQGSEMWGI